VPPQVLAHALLFGTVSWCCTACATSMRHACAYWHPSHALCHLDKQLIPPTWCLLRSRASAACVSHSHFTSQHQPGSCQEPSAVAVAFGAVDAAAAQARSTCGREFMSDSYFITIYTLTVTNLCITSTASFHNVCIQYICTASGTT
jgi:hypothetical protein